MKIYNEDLTKEIQEKDVDYLKYKLIEAKRFVRHHEAVAEVKEQFHYETIREYPNGGKDVKKVIDVEYVEPKEAYDEYEDVLKIEPLSAEELKQNRIYEIQARLNQLSQDFIQADLGAVFDDLEARKSEFKTLHNELRELQGKGKREYIR